MKEVEIYTDGACSGNPGDGGWGAILIYKGTEKIQIPNYNPYRLTIIYKFFLYTNLPLNSFLCKLNLFYTHRVLFCRQEKYLLLFLHQLFPRY